MAGWLVSRQELTTEQVRAVEMSPEQHRVVTGPPGSGKTLVLLHRARHLADTMKVPPERFLILAYTNALSQYIREALKDLEIPEDRVCTFDSLCCDLYTRYVSTTRPWDGANRTIDFAAIRSAVLLELRRNQLVRRSLDFVLVDEGQDLPPEAFAILRYLSWHLTVAIDRKQQIYGGGAAEPELLFALGIRSRSVSFLEAYRCSPYVAGLARRFVRDETEREAFGRQIATVQAQKEKPLLFRATCPEEEESRLAEVARARQALGERVAILVPGRRQVQRLAAGLAQAGIPVEVPANRKRQSQDVRLPALDFSSCLVKVMPYHSAKGLTFDTVLLPRLVDSAFRKVDEEQLLRLLFVGITRATTWVFLSTCWGKEHPVLGAVGLFDGGPDLVVQEGNPLWGFDTKSELTPEQEEDPRTSRPRPVTEWL